MATKTAVFASDGTVNPIWLQQITNEDATVSEITAYFLSGEKLKPDVRCSMNECITLKKTGNKTPQPAQEFNPMLLCFFCNRIYHAGCLDLDSYLIREEKVPFQCNDCKRDLQNAACQAYYEKTAYTIKLITRRAEFLLPSVRETEEQLTKELKFSQSDMDSFNRRATQILLEEDPDVAEFPNLITPYVLKQVMRARANKKRAAEISERFKAELDKTQNQLREVRNETAKLQASRLEESMVDTSGFNAPHTSTMVPPASSTRARTVPTVSGTRAINILSGLYTSGNTTASIETPKVPFSPSTSHPIRNQNPAANASINTNDGNNFHNNSQTVVNTADFTSLLQRLTVSQERDERRNLENIRRRALPKIAEFKGEENKWLAFKQDVDRYREHLGQDEVALKYHIKSALKGEAFDIVRDLFDAESLDVIMSTLKIAFGDEMRMVRNRGEELKNFKFHPNLYRMEAIKLQAAIQAYFAACKYANIGYINTNAIAEAIFMQFNQEDRLRCRDFYVQRNPDAATIVMDVQTIYDYLLKRIPLLDDAPIKRKVNEPDLKAKFKPYQVNNVNISNLINRNKGDYKFEIKDKTTAPYIGYDLDKVALISKLCSFCNSNEHFALQCPQFKDKNEIERVNWIADKGLCKNCVLTTAHTATNCDVKNNCGYKIDKNSRCSARHHIAIHEASNKLQLSPRNNSFKKRRANTKFNTARANERINNAETQNADENNSTSSNNSNETTASTGAAFKLTYNVHVGTVIDSNKADDSPKTVKVFRVKLWGPAGYVVALVIGDSGSEVTLLREDLREALKINGTPQSLQLQWADKSTRTCNALQVNMQIQGIHKDARKFNLNNCFASEDLYLPQRSLNMEIIKNRFPHLKNIPFEGYSNEYPVMLIGAPHAHLIEGCELIEGEEGPIAINTKIGWTVYGGIIHSRFSPTSTNDTNLITEVTKETEDPLEDPVFNENKTFNRELNNMLIGHFPVETLSIRATPTNLIMDKRGGIQSYEYGRKDDSQNRKRRNKVLTSFTFNNPVELLRHEIAENKLLKINYYSQQIMSLHSRRNTFIKCMLVAYKHKNFSPKNYLRIIYNNVTDFSNSNSSSNFELQNKVSHMNEANFTFIHFWLCHSRPLKLFKFKMKKVIAAQNAITKAIQIDGVDINLKLSEILTALEPEFKSIVSACRVRDYRVKKNVGTIFIILMDNQEYRKAINDSRVVNISPGLKVSFPNVLFGNAFFKPALQVIEQSMIKSVPIPVALVDLPRYRYDTTAYVVAILKTFEPITTVNGFRWCLEKQRVMTRSFGFLILASRDEAFQVIERSYNVDGFCVKARLSDSATILLHKVDEALLNTRHKAILTNQVIEANLMNVNRPDELDVPVDEPPQPSPSVKLPVIPPVEDKPRLKSMIVIPNKNDLCVPVDQPPQSSPSVSSSVCPPVKDKPRLKSVIVNPNKADFNERQITQDESNHNDAMTDEDSLVLTLDADEYDLDINEPRCSKSLVTKQESKKDTNNNLHVQAIEPPETFESPESLEPPEAKKPKTKEEETSDYIIMRMDGKFPRFANFKITVVKYIRYHQWVLYREFENSSTAYIKFNNAKQAMKFKDFINGLQHEGKCEVTYSHNTAKSILGAAVAQTLKPMHSAEIMYLINNEKRVLRCRYKEDWEQLIFQLPNFIGDAPETASEASNE